MIGRRLLVAVCAIALAMSACTGDEDPSVAPTPPSDAAETATPTPTPTPDPTPTATETPTPPEAEPADTRVLDDKWYEDANGDHLPDFIAEELGWDPTADPCIAQIDCPGPIDTSGGLDIAPRQENVLLILDASGSMAGSAGGGVTKMQAAKDALERYVVGTPDTVDIGFMVYGHTGSNRAEDKATSCAGIELLAPIGGIDHTNVTDTLARFDSTGYTPIAGALQAARDAFADVDPDSINRIIMVSDGVETCDGDPVGRARALIDSGIEVVIDVVGFDVPDAETAQLREIAEVGGGTYTDARTADDLSGYFRQQREIYLTLIDQRICLSQAHSELTRCYTQTMKQATDALEAHADDTDDFDEGVEIGQINYRMRQHYGQRLVADWEIGQEQQQRMHAAIDEVWKRMRERYGEDVSAAAPCTLGLV